MVLGNIQLLNYTAIIEMNAVFNLKNRARYLKSTGGRLSFGRNTGNVIPWCNY